MNIISYSTILIIDDDDLICQTLNDIFQEKGYKVTIANDGTEAIERVKQMAFDLTLIDISLPDIDGITLLKQFRKDYPESSYIIITGNATLQTAITALKDGADRYFIKPLPIDEIINRAQEIIENQRLRQKLKESEKKFFTLFEEALNPIMIVNENGVCTDVNKSASEFLERGINDIKDTDIRNLFPSDYLNILDKNKSFFLNKYTLEIQYDINSKAKTLLINTVPIELFGKRFLFIIGQNLTDHIIIQQRLETSQERFRKAYKRANFYKDLFSHDISNIINNIISATSLISLFQEKPEKKKEITEFIEIIKDEGNRAVKLISNIQKLYKLEENKEFLKRVEIIKVLNEAVQYIEKSFQKKEIDINIEASSNEFYVNGNEFLLDVFENIIINATRYNINPKVEILIKISKFLKNNNKYIKMEFIDNGIGIPDNRKDIIFQKGYAKKKETKGLGFGLSLVKKIVKSYNGQIQVEDRVKGDFSKGCNFIILIPLL